MGPTVPSRVIYCCDAMEWLGQREPQIASSLVASLPDISEFPGYSRTQWEEWFVGTAGLVLSKTPSSGVSVFFQSDIRIDNEWIDKGFLCQQAARELGVPMLWHRIACRKPPGQITSGRAGYSHILCFSRDVKEAGPAKFPDVLSTVGDKSWERGMGVEVCMLVARFIAECTESTTVINPFCGHGSMLAAANAFGLAAIGIERSKKRSEFAKTLQLDVDARRWKLD